MPRKLFPAYTDHAVQAHLAGASATEIAKQIGSSFVTVRKVLIEAGAYDPAIGKAAAAAKQRHTIDTDEAVRLYLDGTSENEIAKRLGVQRFVVRRHLASAGVPIRDQTEANRLMMSARSPEEHARNTMAAHDAVRGKRQPETTGVARAQAKAKKATPESADERAMIERLRAAGYDAVPQRAVGKYNIDVAVQPVAVEVFGGGWHASGKHAAGWPARRDYLFDQGWNLVVVWVSAQYPLGRGGYDQVVAHIEQTRSDPSLRRQEWMIRGDGQPETIYRRQLYKVA